MFKYFKVLLIVFTLTIIINNSFILLTQGLEYYLLGNEGYSISFEITSIVFFNLFWAILITMGLYIVDTYNIFLYSLNTAIIILIINIKSFFNVILFTNTPIFDFVVISIFGTIIVGKILLLIFKNNSKL